MSPVYVLRFLLFSRLTVLTLLLLSAGNANGHHDDCPDSFDCGNLGTIRYPFTKVERQDCGALAIHGCDDLNKTSVKHVLLDSRRKPFQVTKVETRWWPWSGSISIIDHDFSKLLQNASRSSCCRAFGYNVTLPPPSPFGYFYMEKNITTFKCNLTHPPNNFFKNSTCCPSNLNFYFGPSNYDDEDQRTSCSMLHLPVVEGFVLSANPFPYLTSEITFTFQSSAYCSQCSQDGRGHCRLDTKGKLFCPKRKGGILTRKLALMLGLGIGILGILISGLLLLFLKRIFHVYPLFWRKNPTHRIMEEFLRQHGPLPTPRYSYSEVKKMTNSFRNKLGQGGYGCVYKGKLDDGRVVAVKILSKSKGDGEEFINEVASISRTSHVNIVRLLGFCLDGSKRALIYEFMSNGSLEKFIYEEKNPLQVTCQLDCKILFDIAVGVARGLEYLHRGCYTRILHFDIKPHNILLDEDFCPKVSDFGLAKICQRKESAVSIFGARGTAGYIAPEVFSRNFGVVSHKSDVYSYGMMVLEMVGRRKNINVEVDRTSEIYFPHWIYNRLESNQELGLHNIKNKGDVERMRKMIIVGLWCIQTDPSTRPAISRVVEMLEGRVEVLQIPPKPFLSSPSSSPIHLSCETL